MALTVAKGTITVPTAGVDIVISGLTDPKAIILWGTYQTAAGTSAADLKWGIGFGTYRGAAVQQCYTTIASDDGISDMVASDGFNTDALLRGLTVTPAVDFEIDLVSMDATSVTLDTADAPTTANIVLHYMVLGGSDVTDAQASSFALATASATQDVTLGSGMGNPGDGEGWLSFFAKAQRTAVGQGRGNTGLCVGVDDGTSSAACLAGTRDTLGNVDFGHWQKTGRSILGFTAASADVEANIDSTGHPTDGFQLAFADQASIASRVAGLHLRGDFNTTISETATPTANGNQDLAAGFSETIRGAFLFGGNVTQKTTIDGSHASLGAQWIGGTDLTNEGVAGYHDNDALSFCDIVMWHRTTKALEIHHTTGAENSDALVADADASVSGTNLRMGFTTTTAIAKGYCYLILGDAPAVAAELPILVMAPPIAA